MSTSQKRTILYLLPVLLFAGLYLRSLDYEFVWTDRTEIVHGFLIQPPGRALDAFWKPMFPEIDQLVPGGTQAYYRPLQSFALSLIDHNFGRQPRYFRALSFGLGAATILLFTFFVHRLTRDLWLASFAGAVLAAHPAGIENWVWIANIVGAMVGLFTIVSLIGAQLALTARSGNARAGWVLLSLAGLAVACASKENAVAIPGLLLALCLSVAAGRGASEATPALSLDRGLATAATPLLVGSALLVALFYGVWRPSIVGGVLAGGSPIGGSYATHLWTALRAWPDAIAWLFVPLQSTTSDVVIVGALRHPTVWLGALVVFGSGVVWIWLLAQRRVVAALGLAWIWIAFLPTSGLVPLTHMRAERYLSLSVFGLALLLTDLLPQLAARFGESRRLVAAALAVFVVLGLAQRSWVRIPDWRNEIVLFERGVEADPRYREGYYVLANALAEKGRFKEAQLRLLQLGSVNDQFAPLASFLRDSDALELLCRINLRLGDEKLTLAMLEKELYPDNPSIALAPAVFRCGAKSLARAGRKPEAQAIYSRLEELGSQPRSP